MINDLKVIERYIDETARKVAVEFKRQGLLKDNRQTPFQKTEILLYNYNGFKEVINDKYEQIESIIQEGLPKKSKSITSFTAGSYENKSDSDKADEKIEAIEQSIQTTRNFVKVIEIALDAVADDPYYEIIDLKYFQCKSREEIAEYYDVDVRTITRNKNRLINQLQVRLFSDEYILQIFS